MLPGGAPRAGSARRTATLRKQPWRASEYTAAAGEHRRHRPGRDGLEPRPQLRQPQATRSRLQPLRRQDRRAARRARPEGDFVRAETIAEFVAALEKPRRVIIMVKAGDATDAVIDELADAAGAGRHHHRRRQRALHRHHPPREGDRASAACTSSAPASPAARRARCNGPVDHARRPRRVLRVARPDARGDRRARRRRACCTHIGPDGAGHFVKMVHNGIEYADMQLIGEAYDLLRDGARHVRRPRSPTSSPSGTRATSTATSSRSPPRCCARSTPRPASRSSTSSSTQAEQKGTGRWTVQVRARPRRAGHRHRRGRLRPRAVRSADAARGRARAWPRPSSATSRADADAVHRGRPPGAVRLEDRRLRAGLQPDPGRRRASTTGTSTSATWPRSGAAAASSAPSSSTGSRRPTTTTRDLPTLLVAPYFRDGDRATRRTAGAASSSTATELGIPIPGFASALSYYDALRAERLPAALTQGLRDFFGAHTYGRIDSRRHASTRCGAATAPRSRPRARATSSSHRPGYRGASQRTMTSPPTCHVPTSSQPSSWSIAPHRSWGPITHSASTPCSSDARSSSRNPQMVADSSTDTGAVRSTRFSNVVG